MKGKTYNQEYSTSKGLIQIKQRNKKFFREAKAERIQHHQTRFTTNAKGTSLGGKHKRRELKRKGRKKPYKANPK